MGELKSIKAKLIVWRTLKIAFYLLGFPLLLLLSILEFGEISGGVLEGATIGLKVLLAAWLAVVLVQVIVALFIRSKKAKAIIVAIIAFAITLAPIAYIDFVMEKEFEELQEEYEAKGYLLDNMAIHTSNYKEKVEDHDDEMDRILDLYNIIEPESKVYGGENTDLTPYTDDVDSDIFLEGYGGREHYIFGKDAGDAYYSINGMYADGYVFGFNQLHYILKTYHSVAEKFASVGKDVEEELSDAILALSTDPNSDWNSYKQTPDYLRAYGDAKFDGTVIIDGEEYDESVMYAKSYYITPERVDAILGAIKRELSNTTSKDNQSINDLLAAVKGALSLIGMGDFAGFVDLDNLELDKILPLLEGMNLTEADLFGMLEGLSNYQSPTTYPVFYFIEDESLRDYAYAKYFAEVHGAKVGSVLIGERVGNVTMSTSGYEAPVLSEIVELLDNLAIEKEFMTKFYPFFAIRNFLMVFSGVISLALIFSYAFAALESRLFSRLTVKHEGDR